MAPRGTGYTSIGDYLNANQGTLESERGALTGMVGGELDDATKAADQVVAGVQHGTDPTTAAGYGDALQKQNESRADAALLGTHGGLQDLLERKYGDTASQGDFDANLLTGGAGFSGVQQRAQTLGDYLDAQLATASGTVDKPLHPGGSPNMPGTGSDIPQSGSGTGAPTAGTGSPADGGGGGGGPKPADDDDRWKKEQ